MRELCSYRGIFALPCCSCKVRAIRRVVLLNWPVGSARRCVRTEKASLSSSALGSREYEGAGVDDVYGGESSKDICYEKVALPVRGGDRDMAWRAFGGCL